MIDTLSLIPDDKQDRFDSRYRMVIAASQRAKHLIHGVKPTGQSRFTKETTVALDEVKHAFVEFLSGKEARQAIKEAKRGKESEVEPMATAEAVEDMKEIRKELNQYVDDSTKPSEGEGEN